LPLYAEGGAVLLGVLTVLAPPIGVIAVLLLAWLLLAGRRREGQKYAGLRILR
jgi:protein-S-isoprenylcysteine O-methyltransferase Ste14